MEGSRVHWFSILNSLMVITFLAGIVFVIFLRTVRRDLTRYEELDKEAQEQMNEELSGWKLVVGDVFREPNHSKLLCVMIGDGVQITGMALVTIVFAALGFMSPASRGMPTNWDDHSLSFPGHCCRLCCCSPLTNPQGNDSRMKIAFLFSCMLLSWNCLCYPCSTEFYSMGQQKFYYMFRFLLIVLLLLIIICAEVSVVLTYMHLCVEDWQWWWDAFFASGSVVLLLPILSSSVVVVVFSCAIEVQEEIVETGITCEATCLS
ncbi:hypothetical protein V6N13_140445 [Hibiscus sabdariffa]